MRRLILLALAFPLIACNDTATGLELLEPDAPCPVGQTQQVREIDVWRAGNDEMPPGVDELRIATELQGFECELVRIEVVAVWFGFVGQVTLFSVDVYRCTRCRDGP